MNQQLSCKFDYNFLSFSLCSREWIKFSIIRASSLRFANSFEKWLPLKSGISLENREIPGKFELKSREPFKTIYRERTSYRSFMICESLLRMRNISGTREILRLLLLDFISCNDETVIEILAIQAGHFLCQFLCI